MKHLSFYCLLFLVISAFYSCQNAGPIKEENARLSQTIDNLKKENVSLQIKIDSLEKQVKELSETAAAMYEQARKYRDQEQYDAAITILEKLIIRANGEPIAKKAEAEIVTLKNIKAQKQKAEEKAKKDAFTDIGGGFAVRRVSGKSFSGMAELVGEIKNNSGQNYSIVNIIIALYDSEDNLLGNAIANISNFNTGAVKTFSAYSDVPLNKIARYRVQFENAI